MGLCKKAADAGAADGWEKSFVELSMRYGYIVCKIFVFCEFAYQAEYFIEVFRAGFRDRDSSLHRNEALRLLVSGQA